MHINVIATFTHLNVRIESDKVFHMRKRGVYKTLI